MTTETDKSIFFKGVRDAAPFILVVSPFATLFGGLAPGGLGMTDWALIQGTSLITRCTTGVATASAFLVRVATLWIGVAIGALALLKVSAMLGGTLELEHDSSTEAS